MNAATQSLPRQHDRVQQRPLIINTAKLQKCIFQHALNHRKHICERCGPSP
jgi:hypothetical protein